MARIEVYKSRDDDWNIAKPPAGQTESQGASRTRHAGGGPEVPQVLEVRANAGQQVGVHAHETGEVFYIVKGEMIFGQHSLKPGDSIYIPGMMLYSFKAGPEGVQFLNLRPRVDLTHFWPDDIQAIDTLPDSDKPAFIADNVEKAKRYYGMID